MPEVQYKRPYIYPKQLDAIFHEERIGVIEASTKSGKTYGCIVWLCEQALATGKPNRHYWWVAPIYKQAEIAYHRLKHALPENLIKTNETNLTITLVINGAIIEFKSAEKPDNLYGEDVFAAVFDEATRAREAAWFALRSTLTATRAPVRIIGNVRGRRNWVYKLGRSRADVRYARITAYDAAAAGIIDIAEIEAARRELNDENIFRELYLAEAGDDGGNPFSLKHLDACYLAQPPAVVGTIQAYGIDLAKKRDWTVIIGIDEFGYVAYYERFQDTWENTKPRIINVIGKRTPTLCDATGVGDPIVESLQAAGCNVEGFIFSPSSKQVLMQNLKMVIQGSEISWSEEQLQEELEAFEYEYTRTGVRYAAPDGMHDDSVDSLGLAAKIWVANRGVFWPYENITLEGDQQRDGRVNNMRRSTRRVREGRPEMAGVMGADF